MKILGIDPGTARTGWGVIKIQNSKFKIQNYGCIETPARKLLEERLEMIYKKIRAIIRKEKPQCVAVEQLYFFKNIKTALSVGHARGVIILAAKREKKQIFEYTPLQVKNAVVGYGRANKHQVQQMVKAILKLDKIPKSDDAADGLATAICCAQSKKLEKLKIS